MGHIIRSSNFSNKIINAYYFLQNFITPRKKGSSGASDSFLVTSAEGRLQLVGGVRLGSGAPSARLEKGVDAHRGACLSGRWSHDGAGIVTGGEDGAVKIWSRSGMLR